MSKKNIWILASVVLASVVIIFVGLRYKPSSNSPTNNSYIPGSPKHFEVTIDWVPSPEYYGFFVAKNRGFYRDLGLDVTINNGSGAPIVANQIAAGSIYAGTTTSDNIVRQVSRGGKFARVVPILKFNPAVVISLTSSPVRVIQELRGLRVGVNKQSSVYQQFRYVIEQIGLNETLINEVPIGWGGPAQLLASEVDAIIHYASNGSIDVMLHDQYPNEIFLSDYGIHLYGLVLAFAEEAVLNKSGITSDDLSLFIQATLRGYEEGASDLNLAVNALQDVSPTIDAAKIKKAVQRISELNKSKASSFEQLDKWLVSDNVNEDSIKLAHELYR